MNSISLIYLAISYILLDSLFVEDGKMPFIYILCYSACLIPISFILYYLYYNEFTISLILSLFFSSLCFGFRIVTEYIVCRISKKRPYIDLIYLIQMVLTYSYLIIWEYKY